MRGTDMHKIVLLDKPRENPGELDWSPLQALGETVFYAHTEPEEAAARIGDAEIVLLNKTVLTAETLRQCKNLKLISVIATGYNTVDVDCCRELGITVCNVPSYGSEAISQNAIALLLELTNRVAHHDAEVRKGPQRRAGRLVLLGLLRHGARGQDCRDHRSRPHREDHRPHPSCVRHEDPGARHVPGSGLGK